MYFGILHMLEHLVPPKIACFASRDATLVRPYPIVAALVVFSVAHRAEVSLAGFVATSIGSRASVKAVMDFVVGYLMELTWAPGQRSGVYPGAVVPLW